MVNPQKHPAGHRRIRRHRRARQGRVQGRGARQQVPRATSARRTPSRTWCAASKTTTWCMWPGASTRCHDIEVINTELRWRISKPSRSGSSAPRRWPRPTRKKDVVRLLPAVRNCWSIWKAASRRALRERRTNSGRLSPKCTCSPTNRCMYVANVAEDDLAGNTPTWPGPGASPRPTAPRWWWSVPPSKPRYRSWTGATNRPSSKTWGSSEPGLDRLIRSRLQTAGPADLFHRRRQGGAGLDRSQRHQGAAGRRRDPHRFRERLHPRRSHRLCTTTSPAMASRAPRRRGCCALEGKEYVMQEGDVVHFRFNV